MSEEVEKKDEAEPAPEKDEEEEKPEPGPREEEDPASRPRRVPYAKLKRGRLRSTNEEGIGAEVKAMQEEASGSPFFGREKKNAKKRVDVDALRRKVQEKREEDT